MHNFENEAIPEDRLKNETELQYCLTHQNGDLFVWYDQNFNVGLEMIERVIEIFFPPNSTDVVPVCDKLKQKGFSNNFVLNNVWCQQNDGNASSQHYYWDH